MGFVSLKENVENGQKKKQKKNQMILVMSNEHTIQLRSSKKKQGDCHRRLGKKRIVFTVLIFPNKQ